MTKSCMLQNHILRYIGVNGTDFDFDRVLNCHSVAIPDFDLSNFSDNDNVPSEAQHILVSSFLIKVIRT